jgi:enolase
MKSVAAGASLEEKVAFLLRRDEEAQGAVNALAERVAAIEEQAPRQLEQLRGEMQAHVDQKIRAALDEYRELRVAGTVALGLGLACVTVANFV